MSTIPSVLFVCLGNICRSPTGEGVFQSWLANRGHDGVVVVDSAGTSGYHAGEPADARMRQHASRRGYELSSRSRQVEPADFERFDRIIAMDLENLRNLQGLARRAGGERPGQVRLFSEFLPSGHAYGAEVPDPYYGGAEGFETVLDMIEAGCEALFEDLLAEDSTGG